MADDYTGGGLWRSLLGAIFEQERNTMRLPTLTACALIACASASAAKPLPTPASTSLQDRSAEASLRTVEERASEKAKSQEELNRRFDAKMRAVMRSVCSRCVPSQIPAQHRLTSQNRHASSN
ncbi:hypothetical protein [Methylobacterium nigriterrae]|uniref:hypothetical protein n=1 Tax=Methylobacterium nigriterrae TaxID=3127512 RepID=UPI003013F44D